jgi:hypothetical protein
MFEPDIVRLIALDILASDDEEEIYPNLTFSIEESPEIPPLRWLVDLYEEELPLAFSGLRIIKSDVEENDHEIEYGYISAILPEDWGEITQTYVFFELDNGLLLMTLTVPTAQSGRYRIPFQETIDSFEAEVRPDSANQGSIPLPRGIIMSGAGRFDH